jgi:hypothetical protein
MTGLDELERMIARFETARDELREATREAHTATKALRQAERDARAMKVEIDLLVETAFRILIEAKVEEASKGLAVMVDDAASRIPDLIVRELDRRVRCAVDGLEQKKTKPRARMPSLPLVDAAGNVPLKERVDS